MRFTLRFNRRKCKSLFYGFAYYLCCVAVIENLLFLSYWHSPNKIPAGGEIIKTSVTPSTKHESLNISNRPTLLVILNRTVPTTPASKFNVKQAIVANKQILENFNPKSPTIRPPTNQNQTANVKVPPPIVPARNRVVQAATPIKNITEKDYYKKQPTKVNPYEYSLTVTPRSPCPPDLFMVILVHTFHSHTDRRAAIRATWASVIRTNGSWTGEPRIRDKLRLVFMLGLHSDPGLNELIREESEIHDDVAVGNFTDSYRNMTLKSLLGLKYVGEFCPSAKYLLKSDDDMFIHLPYLIDVIKSRNLKRAIMGPYNLGSKAYRSGKWKLTYDEFPFQYLPPYESGAAYVITGDLIKDLFITSEYVPSIFIDDVYITGILGKILNVTHIKQDGFAFWTYRPPAVCDIIMRRILTGTKATPEVLRNIWRDLSSGKNASSCATLVQTAPVRPDLRKAAEMRRVGGPGFRAGGPPISRVAVELGKKGPDALAGLAALRRVQEAMMQMRLPDRYSSELNDQDKVQ